MECSGQIVAGSFLQAMNILKYLKLVIINWCAGNEKRERGEKESRLTDI